MFSVKEFLLRVKRYFQKNLGAALIIGFQVLLLAAAGFLAVGNPALANDVAVYTRFFLVDGVVFQLFSFLKYGGQR